MAVTGATAAHEPEDRTRAPSWLPPGPRPLRRPGHDAAGRAGGPWSPKRPPTATFPTWSRSCRRPWTVCGLTRHEALAPVAGSTGPAERSGRLRLHLPAARRARLPGLGARDDLGHDRRARAVNRPARYPVRPDRSRSRAVRGPGGAASPSPRRPWRPQARPRGGRQRRGVLRADRPVRAFPRRRDPQRHPHRGHCHQAAFA